MAQAENTMTETPHFNQMTVNLKIANAAQKVSLNFKTQTKKLANNIKIYAINSEYKFSGKISSDSR
jgi:hypothetical protein